MALAEKISAVGGKFMMRRELIKKGGIVEEGRLVQSE